MIRITVSSFSTDLYPYIYCLFILCLNLKHPENKGDETSLGYLTMAIQSGLWQKFSLLLYSSREHFTDLFSRGEMEQHKQRLTLILLWL